MEMEVTFPHYGIWLRELYASPSEGMWYVRDGLIFSTTSYHVAVEQALYLDSLEPYTPEAIPLKKEIREFK